MFSKSNLLSTLVTTLWGFFGGYLLWGLIGDPFLTEHYGVANATMMEVPDFTFLLIGCLVTGFAFSTIFSKWSRGAHSISQGAEFGIWVGILLGFGGGIIDFSTMGLLDLVGTFVNGLIYVVHFTVMGILASIVYNKTSGGQSGSE